MKTSGLAVAAGAAVARPLPLDGRVDHGVGPTHQFPRGGLVAQRAGQPLDRAA